MASLNTSYMVNGTSALKAERIRNLVLVDGGKSYDLHAAVVPASASKRASYPSREVAASPRVRTHRGVRRIEPLPEPVAATPVLDSDQELAATLGLLGAIAIVILGSVLLGGIL